MPLIDDVRENTAKMKGKSLKEKLSYFWGYYKLPLIVFLFLLFIGISLIKASIDNKPIAFEAVYINAYEAPEVEPFAEKIGVDLTKNQVVFDTSYSMASSREEFNELSSTSAQKLVAVVAAAAADVMMSNKTIAESYFDSEFFADLRDYFTEDELNSLGDKVIWAAPKDFDTGEPICEEFPIAIHIGDSPVHQAVPTFLTDEVYFSVFVNAPHPELVKPFFEFLYNK